jgi:SAM-dependent methyltransferase
MFDPQVKEKNVAAFAEDVSAGDGYVYTSPDLVSARLANERITQAILAICPLAGLRVLDVGCGDGTYSREYLERGEAAALTGIDACEPAIVRARELYAEFGPRAAFDVCDVYDLGKYSGRFDVAIVRGVLHHLYDPVAAITQIVRTAPLAVWLEPNGHNPGLKLLEKVSPYHRKHEERSYSSGRLRSWFARAGCVVVKQDYLGLVPMFCPAPVARLLKAFEPAVESVLPLKSWMCAQYIALTRSRA